MVGIMDTDLASRISQIVGARLYLTLTLVAIGRQEVIKAWAMAGMLKLKTSRNLDSVRELMRESALSSNRDSR